MREIKFRVWASNDINPNGEMYYPGDSVEAKVGNHKSNGAFVLSQHGDLFLPRENNLESNGFTLARVSNNELCVMQYTGLKDKNGKEIYEGDIINFGYGNISDVKYISQYGAFLVKDKFGDLRWLHNAAGSANAQIIGNIYENKELL